METAHMDTHHPSAMNEESRALDSSPMIEVDHVSMRFNMASQQLNNLKEFAIALAKRELFYKEFIALDDISLTVDKGDVFGILGSNGSGKSTLLKIIAGVLEPTRGTVSVNGNIAPLIELGAGFDHELTARENIYLNGALLGYTQQFISEHFDEIVDFAEIRDFLDLPIKNYSSGMIARIAFAIATVIVPDILIVDEVLSVGDFLFQQKCEYRIQTLIQEYGTTVLIVSHNTDQIERLCNKAVWIEKGHMRAQGDAKDVCDLYQLLSGYAEDPLSKAQILALREADIAVPERLITSIHANDRYECAANLARDVFIGQQRSAVIAHGRNACVPLIATSLASSIDAPLLLTQEDILPSATIAALRDFSPQTIYVLDTGATITEQVIASIHGVAPQAKVQIVSGSTDAETAERAYEQGDPWSNTAILAWEGSIGDVISFAPFISARKVPIFFKPEGQSMSESTQSVLTGGHFDRVLVLGGCEIFSDQDLLALNANEIEAVRFCGKDAYDANKLINEWIEDERLQAGDERVMRYIVSSIWHPEYLLAIGQYTNKVDASILLVDAQNLDSIAQAAAFLESRNSSPSEITFVGSHVSFSKQEQDILGKAATKQS